MNTYPMHRPYWLLALSLAFVDCTASKEASRGVGWEGPQVPEDTDRPASGGKSSRAAEAAQPNQPQISNRAKMLFDDALKSMEKKGANPDYAGLERKFQAALAADDKLAEANYNLGVLAERQGKKE